MAHALTAHTGLGHFHTTSVTDNAFISDLLILSAMAFPVLSRSEDTLAEQAVPFRLQGSVVDGLRLLNLASGPLPDLLRGGQTNLYGIKRHRLIYFIFCSCFRHCALLPKRIRQLTVSAFR